MIGATVSLKEFVEMLEERMPGGRYATSVLLGLTFLGITVFLGSYLKNAAIDPLAAWLVASAGSEFRLMPPSPLTVVTFAMVGALILVTHLLSRMVVRMVTAIWKHLDEQVWDIIGREGENLVGLFKNVSTLTDSVKGIVEVVSQLQTRVDVLEASLKSSDENPE